MRQLKSGGLDVLPEQVRVPLTKLVDKFKAVGLFLVPVGELEEWLTGCNIGASKRTKWAWANEAATYIRTHPTRSDDIWKFMSDVGQYLTTQFD